MRHRNGGLQAAPFPAVGRHSSRLETARQKFCFWHKSHWLPLSGIGGRLRGCGFPGNPVACVLPVVEVDRQRANQAAFGTRNPFRCLA